mmetsp:Transcript_18423/g.50631  ORF Transcript_18423/g.50631 Transcript_18423/m.50631 type:complete len:315 (-) Transcript_18423:523-1467(-)
MQPLPGRRWRSRRSRSLRRNLRTPAARRLERHHRTRPNPRPLEELRQRALLQVQVHRSPEGWLLLPALVREQAHLSCRPCRPCALSDHRDHHPNSHAGRGHLGHPCGRRRDRRLGGGDPCLRPDRLDRPDAGGRGHRRGRGRPDADCRLFHRHGAGGRDHRGRLYAGLRPYRGLRPDRGPSWLFRALLARRRVFSSCHQTSLHRSAGRTGSRPCFRRPRCRSGRRLHLHLHFLHRRCRRCRSCLLRRSFLHHHHRRSPNSGRPSPRKRCRPFCHVVGGPCHARSATFPCRSPAPRWPWPFHERQHLYPCHPRRS